MSLKLYEISATLMEIMHKVESASDNPESSLSISLKEALDEWNGDFDAKVLDVAAVAESLDAEADAFEAVAKRKAAHAKSLRGRAEWLRDYAINSMRAVGRLEIKGDGQTLRIKTGPGSVDVTDPQQVPEQFWRVIPETKEVNRADLRAALLALKKADKEPALPGARLVFSEKLESK